MIAFEDQAALDRYVQRVLLAHLDASEAPALDAVKKTHTDVPTVAQVLMESTIKITFAVQRAAVMKLPLPSVRR